jgi:1,4-alpha-glucan branching enzyme
MKNFYFLLLFFLFSFFKISAQVTTDPALVLESSPVTIYYDATKGTSGLKGASKVYIHSGVITTSSTGTGWEHVVGNWGKDDGVGLMQKVEGQTDVWKINISSIREYFKVPADKKIYRLGMVFRNADGSKEGKNDANQDIFVQVFDGFSVSITKPNKSQIFFDSNEQIDYEAIATQNSNLVVYFNDKILSQVSDKKIITGSFIPESGGTLKVVGKIGSDESEATVDLFLRNPSANQPLPANILKGININSSEKSVSLALHAPQKESVYVVGDFSDWKINQQYLMNKDGDHFWITLTDLNPDVEYAYYYLVDEEIKIADPYSYKVLDRSHDEEIINLNKYAGLRSFPTQSGTQRLSVFKINRETYQWQVDNFQKPAKEDLIIYELLVRDFTDHRSFDAVIEKLGYLKSLGINALELMPVKEFEGNLSWGYNPSYFFAVDKFYGSANNLKKLVDECHKKGIAVILDVVYNHSFSQSPLLQLYFDAVKNKPAVNNPWYREDHIFSNPGMRFGYQFDHASPYFRAFLDSANHFWIKEYKIDGFRFDLTKGFTSQLKGSNDEWGSRYDQERVNNLKRMADKIWDIDDKSYVILEHLADNDEEKVLADHGMMLWGNQNYTYSEAAMGWHDGGKSNFSGISYKNRNFNKPHVVGYMESHDEERMMFRLINYGATAGNYNTKQLKTAIDRAKLATSFFLTVPGPKMIWQFGELGYDVSIDHQGRLGVKPTKWEYFENEERRNLFNVYAALNKLKVEENVFRTEDFSLDVAGNIKSVKLNSQTTKVNIIGNFSTEKRNLNILFQEGGDWWDYFTGEKITLGNNQFNMDLDAGQYHIFFNKEIVYDGENPSGFTLGGRVTSLNRSNISDYISVYPNPAKHNLKIEIGHQKLDQKEVQVRLLNLQGSILHNERFFNNFGQQFDLNLQNLKPGLYLLEIQSGQEQGLKKIIIK